MERRGVAFLLGVLVVAPSRGQSTDGESDKYVVVVSEAIGDRNWTDSEIGKVKDDLSDLLGRTSGLKAKTDKLNDIPGAVQGQVLARLETNLTSEELTDLQEKLKDAFGSAFDQAKAAFDGQAQALQNLGAFDCPAYQLRLGDLVSGIGTILSSLPKAHAALPPLPDLNQAAALVAKLPCPALFLMSQILDIAPSQWVTDQINAVGVIAGLLDAGGSAMSPTPGESQQRSLAIESSSTLFDCRQVDAEKVLLKRYSAFLQANSVYFRILAAIVSDDTLIAKGPLAALPKMGDQDLGIHGYAGFSLRTPKWDNRIAKSFEVIAEVYAALGNSGFLRVRHCELTVLMNDTKELVEALKNASSDGIENTVLSAESRLADRIINSQHELSTLIDTRTNNHSASFDSWTGLSLQLRIEELLSRDGSSDVATLQLPAKVGGLLDLVRDIVDGAIAQTVASGGKVNGAEKEWRKGNDSFAGGDFKGAYDHYEKAYKSVSKSSGKGKGSDDDSD